MMEPGMLVKCIRAEWPPPMCSPAESDPVLGGIYTIREIVEWPGSVMLRLEELRNPPAAPPYLPVEPAYFAKNFKPIRKPSIEVFRRAVQDITEDVDA